MDSQEHEDRRRKILEATGRCFARDGFRGAGISDICKEANISAGHLYHHFENEEAVVREMTEAAVAQTCNWSSCAATRSTVVE